MPDSKKEKVLIIEDDRTLSKLYQSKLSKSGYTVEVALDGEEGLKKVDEFSPEIILLDIIIPKIDGFTVLERLRSQSKNQKTPIILLTNLGQDEDVERGKSLGADDYLVKSNFTPTEIVVKMEDVLQKKLNNTT